VNQLSPQRDDFPQCITTGWAIPVPGEKSRRHLTIIEAIYPAAGGQREQLKS
jgi:hypothetical protein